MSRATSFGAAMLATALVSVCRAAPPAPPASRDALAVRRLDSVLASKNDNDPRLDRDFNDLSLDARRAFRRRYFQAPPEARNERGTIVYLLGKNLRSAEDWAFLRHVVEEPPCLSLGDCSRRARDAEPGEAVTLASPALVALKQAERELSRPDGARAPALVVVRAGERSRSPVVVALSRKILLSLGRLN